MANRYANLPGAAKIKDTYDRINQGFDLVEQDVDQLRADLNQEIADREAAVEYVDQRVDNIIVGGGPDKDPELVDIRTVDPSYTPQREINVAGDVTRDMQAQFAAHKADFANRNVRPIVSFMADDGPLEDYTKLKPLSEEYGIPFTLAIITNYETTWTNNLLKPENISKLRELVNDFGWEVASHTHNHFRLSELTAEEQEFELSESKRILESLGFKPRAIVYPYGAFNSDTVRIARKYYECGYRAGTNTLNDSPIDTYTLGRIQFDITNPNNNFAWYKEKIDEAVSKKKWIIFMLHSANYLGWLDSDQIALLRQVIEYVQSLGVDITTCQEAYDAFKNVYETQDGHRIGAKGVKEDITYASNNVTIDKSPWDFEQRTKEISALTAAFVRNESGLPSYSASIVETDLLHTTEFAKQMLIDYYGNLWIRTGIAGKWNDFALQTVSLRPIQKSLTFGTLSPKSSKTLTITVPGCTIDDIAIANPKLPLPDGLVWNVHINSNDTVSVTVTNVTDSTVTDNGRNWIVRVLSQNSLPYETQRQ